MSDISSASSAPIQEDQTPVQILGRWYEALGGTGLEIKRGDSEWRSVGYIQNRKRQWDIRVNPYQDEGYTLASCESLEAAKVDFLRRMGVTEVVADV